MIAMPQICEWPPALGREHARDAPERPPVPSARSIGFRAIEHHQQWLALHARDDAAFERLSATSADVRGELVVLRQGAQVVGRYRWRWRYSGGRYVLGFVVVT